MNGKFHTPTFEPSHCVLSFFRIGYTELLRPFIKAVCVINAFNETDFLLLTDFHTSFIAVSPYFFIIPQLAAFPCYDEVSKAVDQSPHVAPMRKAVWTNVSQVNVSPRESSTKNSFSLNLKDDMRSIDLR